MRLYNPTLKCSPKVYCKIHIYNPTLQFNFKSLLQKLTLFFLYNRTLQSYFKMLVQWLTVKFGSTNPALQSYFRILVHHQEWSLRLNLIRHGETYQVQT